MLDIARPKPSLRMQQRESRMLVCGSLGSKIIRVLLFVNMTFRSASGLPENLPSGSRIQALGIVVIREVIVCGEP